MNHPWRETRSGTRPLGWGARLFLLFVLVSLVAPGGPATAATLVCADQCDDYVVDVQEMATALSVALASTPPGGCVVGDVNEDGTITVDELVRIVGRRQTGCTPKDPDDLDVPDDFNYDTSRRVLLDITVLSPTGAPFASVAVMVFDPAVTTPSEATVTHQGVTDRDGRFVMTVEIPAHLTSLRVIVSALGIPNDAVVPIVDGAATHTFSRNPKS